MEQKLKKPVPPELRRAIRFKKRKKIFENMRISIATVIAAFFAILFLMPIVLTITNSFMSSSEISANYGSIFATNDKGGKVYISEKVNLKFIPDIVSFSQYTTVLLKSPEYLLKFWNSVILVVPIVLAQLMVASIAAYGFTRCDPGGTDRAVSADRGIAGVLWIRQVLGEAEVIGIFLLCDIDADAVSGNAGTKLSGGGKAEYIKYVLGYLAARDLFTLCSLSADEVHEENSCGSHGSGTD